MPFADIPGSVVHYELDGGGPGLALVHGAGGDAQRAFGNIVDSFHDSHTVIRPNLSGSGRTTDDGGELGLEIFAGQVSGAIEQAVDGPVDLLCFSLGAAVAVTVAATRPDLVRRLILVGGLPHTGGPHDKFNFDFWRDLYVADFDLFKRFATLQGFGPATLDIFGHEGLAASLKDEWPHGLSRQIVAAANADVRDLLPRITIPTLIIGFTGDQVAPIAGSRRLHAAVPGSRLVEIEGEGHMDWFANPARIVQLTKEFIA
ncbi:alpha/beta fold hydrolase [Nocardia crassostreae]|uniref:alpha/beta fold hydrolase n=1 Tax=Nocardia crassostreae TaxID=53428 RepID=UPI00082B240F|nr:alpha/beta hydrolase [Nocardia crassostreae]